MAGEALAKSNTYFHLVWISQPIVTSCYTMPLSFPNVWVPLMETKRKLVMGPPAVFRAIVIHYPFSTIPIAEDTHTHTHTHTRTHTHINLKT